MSDYKKQGTIPDKSLWTLLKEILVEWQVGSKLQSLARVPHWPPWNIQMAFVNRPIKPIPNP